MLNSDDWKPRVAAMSETFCPACESTKLTMGACAIGSMTVHQEYTCENCQYEFTVFFTLAGYYDGHPDASGLAHLSARVMRAPRRSLTNSVSRAKLNGC